MTSEHTTQDDYKREQEKEEVIRMDVKSRVQHFLNTPCDTEEKLDSAIRRLFYYPPDQQTRATQTDPVKRKRRAKKGTQKEDTQGEQVQKKKRETKRDKPTKEIPVIDEPQKTIDRPIIMTARNTSPTLIRVRSMQDLGSIRIPDQIMTSETLWHEPTAEQRKKREEVKQVDNTRAAQSRNIPEQIRRLLTSEPTPLHQLCNETLDKERLTSGSKTKTVIKGNPVRHPKKLREERKTRLKEKQNSKKRKLKPRHWHDEVVVSTPVSLNVDSQAVEEPQPEYQCSIINNGTGIKLQVAPRTNTRIVTDNAEMDITTRRTKQKPKENWILKQWPTPQVKTLTLGTTTDDDIMVEWSSTTHHDPRLEN